MNIYSFFNSADIAAHCKKINHKFTSTETAYLVWQSNHHTLAEKHEAWREIVETLPDEQFHPNWDFDGHSLHSFLLVYMQLQRNFIESFCAPAERYAYTYSTLVKYDDRFINSGIFFDNFDACRDSLRINEFESRQDEEIVKARITRHYLHSQSVSSRDAIDVEAIIFDKSLNPLEIEAICTSEGEERFLGPSNGFYEMWLAIPTPFKAGDILMDVDVFDSTTKKNVPFILECIPYWKRGARDGEGSSSRINMLLKQGVDWTDMQEHIYLQDSNGELYQDHAFSYLNLEYYRDEFCGREKLLIAASEAMKGDIGIVELLKRHGSILKEPFDRTKSERDSV